MYTIRLLFYTDAGFVVISNLGCSDRDRDALTYSFNQQPSDNRFKVSPFGELKVNGNVALTKKKKNKIVNMLIRQHT